MKFENARGITTLLAVLSFFNSMLEEAARKVQRLRSWKMFSLLVGITMKSVMDSFT
jgi:hypothetical protein